MGMMYRNSSYADKQFDYYLYEKDVFGNILAIYNASGPGTMYNSPSCYGSRIGRDSIGSWCKNLSLEFGEVTIEVSRFTTVFPLGTRYLNKHTALKKEIHAKPEPSLSGNHNS